MTLRLKHSVFIVYNVYVLPILISNVHRLDVQFLMQGNNFYHNAILQTQNKSIIQLEV